MHLDLGQLQPDGFSCKGPSSRVAEQSKSSLSKRPSKSSGLGRFEAGGESDADMFDTSLERFPRLPSVGDSPLVDGESSFGIVTFLGMTTRDLNWSEDSVGLLVSPEPLLAESWDLL